MRTVLARVFDAAGEMFEACAEWCFRRSGRLLKDFGVLFEKREDD